MKFLFAHSQRHHAAHLFAGLSIADVSARFVVPFYPKGLGKIISAIPLSSGRKASGFLHPAIRSNSVIAPTSMQLAKILSRYFGANYLERRFDKWVAAEIARGALKAEIFVCLQDFMPLSAKAAKDAGMKIWSDQIINLTVAASARIDDHCRRFGILASPYDQYQNLEILSNADIVSYPSQFVRGGLEGICKIGAKALYSPYGVDTHLFHPIGQKDKIIDDTLNLVARANNVRKGGHLLLSALIKSGDEILSLAKKKKMRIEMIGLLSSELVELMAALQRKPWCNITCAEYNYVDLPQVLARAHLFVMPSLAEGMSLMIPEAMSCGAIVVGTPYCGVDYLSDNETGIVVDDSIDSLTDGLRRAVINLESGGSLGRKARVAAENNSWVAYTKRIEDFACTL